MRYSLRDLRLRGGEEVPIGLYYFKTAPLLETSSEEYAFLNRNIFVGIRRPSDVQMKFYQVL
ncbi:DUF3237 family protein [[Brevibacterium] frigoritolerans]|uniref:DUF3237 family protein n=1 Tax=Peribacillus frigoritolerans TaxID=450367 RepID=A0A941J908_9BACI|nr:DUF3237 family protein [Peribacillus frigoritolerans]